MCILVWERGSRGEVLTAVGTHQVVIKVGDKALAKKELAALIMPVGLGRLGHLGLSEMLLSELSRSHQDLYRPSLTCLISRLISKVLLKEADLILAVYPSISWINRLIPRLKLIVIFLWTQP